MSADGAPEATLARLVSEARIARERGNDLRVAALHRAIDGLLDRACKVKAD